MKQVEPAVHSDPRIMGGTPVFVGTRVPFQTLLDDFPTVTRDRAIAALEQAKEARL